MERIARKPQSASQDPEVEPHQALRILGAWLRAVRKAQLWLPTCDAAAPLRQLAPHMPTILAAATFAPTEAAEVAEQLAKWHSVPPEAAEILKPLLQEVMKDGMEVSFEKPTWLLPLLQALAENFWPKAAVGELDLDCEVIAKQAFLLLEASTMWEEGTTEELDVEAAIAVWHTLAESLHAAVRASETFSSRGSNGFVPPEKRSRRNERWQLSRERLAEATMVNLLFQLLLQKLLQCLRLPVVPEDDEALATLQNARQAVEAALRPWAALMNAETWSELWTPLQEVDTMLAGIDEDEGCIPIDAARDIEVVIWLFGAFCGCLPEGDMGSLAAQAASQAVAMLVPRLPRLDEALPPWRGLLWCSACSLAAAVNSKLPPNSEPILLDWMLARPLIGRFDVVEHG